MFACYDKNYGLSKMTKNHLLHRNGVGWLGGNFEAIHCSTFPLVSYVIKISHKGLRFGAYSVYQMELSDKVLALRDTDRLQNCGCSDERRSRSTED
jgi:hypothetical protein